MKPNLVLELGSKYSKAELTELLNEPTLSSVREGVFSCKNSDAYLLFVDLEKADKEKRFHFNDFFEEDFFHWDTQTTQHINSPKIQDIISEVLTPHLFVRVRQKEKSRTLPFVYCGTLTFNMHEEKTARPAHIIFQSDDFDDLTSNKNLLEIYSWKPSKAGTTSNSKINKKGVISGRRKRNFKPPNETERKGLITSRIGQGYYRQQIIDKWNGRCAVTNSGFLPVLIASHIVSWSESNDDERLDVENGILLSPIYDALFDKHLISFEDSGDILLSEQLSQEEVDFLNVVSDAKIEVTNGMKPYLKRHREKMLRVNEQFN